jgi:hypothetical protein
VDYVGELAKTSDTNYKIDLDLGPADRKVIAMILNELNGNKIGEMLDKVIIE